MGYPLIPLVAVMPLGYCLGQLFTSAYDAEKRKKILLIVGASAIVLFIALRFSNLYGDPVKWSEQKEQLIHLPFLYKGK